VTYLGGSAERLPLATGSVDAALLFFVWHHVEDRPAAARELARVLKPGGRVLMRSQFADRLAELWWYRWFPRAEEVDRAMYETLPVVTGTFEAAGFRTVTFDEVPDVPTETVRGEFERLKMRAVSTFEHLTEDEIEAGFRAIEEGLEREGEPERDDLRGALLVLERS
jgi:ubiquinone/menaquinone biosynthesis C-methylase UbiE